jgi:hypothetical protein
MVVIVAMIWRGCVQGSGFISKYRKQLEIHGKWLQNQKRM